MSDAGPGTAVHRVALYYQPEENSGFEQAGRRWLSGEALDAAPWPGWSDAPRRYGFHATIKAPFRLASGLSLERFTDRAAEIVSRTTCFELPPLAPVWFDGFLALRPCDGDPPANHPLRCLADECVAALDAWRAPLTPEEVSRRRSEGLSEAQAGHLHRWGYPHVFDTWRFHMTLSARAPGSFDQMARCRLLDAARREFAPVLERPIGVASLALVVEPIPMAGFVVARRLPLRG